MVIVPQDTLSRVDAAVCAVADAIISSARGESSHLNTDGLSRLTSAFRQFAEGVSILIGPVLEGAVGSNASSEETS